MKKTTIFLSLVLALIFSFSSINADTLAIKDIDSSSDYARESILTLAELGIVEGDNLGNYNPTKAISRAEFVALLVRVLELDTENVPAQATFEDVPTNHWAFKYVEAAYKAGIVNGVTADEFGVKKISTREQMAVMFVRALKLVDSSVEIELKNVDSLTDKDSISTWAKREVDIAMTAGLMNGVSETSFAPKKNATKEQTAVVIDRFIQNEDTLAEKVNTAYGINTEVKYPELYNALKADSAKAYIGDMEMIVDMQMTDLDTKDFLRAYNEIYSTVSNKATATYNYSKFETNGEEPVEFETELIMTEDKVYELDLDGKWIVYDRAEWESAGGLGIDTTLADTAVSAEFLSSYNMMPIQKVGTAAIGDINAEKYVMSLDSQAMVDLLPEEQKNELNSLLGEMYQGTEKYDIEFYVADGHIVRQVVSFSGIATDDETGLRLGLKMTIDASFSNIGVNTEIELPAASDIKQPEY